MTLQEKENGVLDVIERCSTLGVQAARLEEYASWARAGEPGVALETLCMELVDIDAQVPATVLENIRTLAMAMGLKEKYWRRLKVCDS